MSEDFSGPEIMLDLALSTSEPRLDLAFGATRLVVLWHPADVGYVLADNAANYSKETAPTRLFREHVADGLLTAPERRWRAERLMVNPATRDTPAIERAARRHADAVVTELSVAAEAGEPVDLTATMSAVTSRITMDALFGWDRDEEVEAAVAAALDSRDIAHRLLPSPKSVAASGVRDRLFEVLTNRIRRQPESDFGPALRDMADAGLSLDRMVHQAVTLLFAGSETTAATLSWTWIELCRNPDRYDRWQHELRAGGARARAASRAVFTEAVRLWPSAWGVGRCAESDDHIGDLPVAAGTEILISSYLTHRMAEFWPEPERFDPGRAHPARRFTYYPFGVGHRMCVGQSFALREAEIVLTALGRRFRFRTEAAVPARPRFEYTLRAPKLPVLITRNPE
ncbi:MAG: cytochrome P450 [Nocardia sp.]|nr:cytochrome P450 [Nocardia sp.]